MLVAGMFIAGGIVGQVMFSSFKDAFFPDRRLKQAEAEAQKLLEAADSTR